MGHSWVAQFELWDPTLQEEGQSPDQGTHLSQRVDQFGLWPCMQRRGKSRKYIWRMVAQFN